MPSILVVDDDRAIQDMLFELLTEQGYDVHACRDGNQVIPTLGVRPCDLLILDVLVPHLNGFVVMERLRAVPASAELPTIMMSGIYRGRNHRAEMLTRFGVIDFLDKPLGTDRLLDLVRGAIGPGQQPKPWNLDELDELVEPDAIMTPEGPVALDAPKPVTLEQPKRAARQHREPPPPPAEAEAGAGAGADAPDAGLASALDPEVARLVEAAASAEQRQVETEARAFRASAFVLQGSLAKTPVAAVIGKLWQQRASGALLLRRARIKKLVYFRSGDPYQLKSNLVSECLGQILMRERLITSAECERSLELMKETGQRQGEVLVQMRSLTRNNLAFALELQAETKLFESFTWDTGEYRFNSCMELPADDAELGWTGPEVVAEGIRRTFDETRLRQWMLPVLDVPLAFHEQPLVLPPLRLSEQEQQALASIEPPVTTRELFDSMPLPPPDTLRVVYTLIALEILVPSV